MLKRKFRHPLVAVLVLVAMLCQGTWVLAGTTGGLSGVVLDENSAAVGAALVTVASPSAVSHTNTGTDGKFVFLALIPDTYTISVEKQGYEPISQTGITVVADQNQTLNLATRHVLRTIGRVTTKAPSSLIKPGTVTDVYSITPQQQEKIAAAGGGSNLNTAWSAIATVPGVFVAPGQQGYIGAGTTLSIRGGNYDQIGYEIDGVPVNRAFDNYPSGPASSLGQQELQVYTGVPPANAEANGLSGFINQVIRAGTYPGFGNIDLGIGGPSYYHKASFEVGGSSPNRNFSYYFGTGGYNQEYRYYDQFNGAALSSPYGFTYTTCLGANTGNPVPIAAAPSCYGGYTGQTIANPKGTFTPGLFNGNTLGGSYVTGPYNYLFQSGLAERDTVANVHFGFPHKNGTKDDIQLLGMWNYIQSILYSSTNDLGGAAVLNAVEYGTPAYLDGYMYNGPTGVLLPLGNVNATTQPRTSIYAFPNVATHPVSLAATGFAGTIPPDQRDGFLNNQAITKVQWTHNMSSGALFKIYGYTYYSDWLNTGPQGLYSGVFGTPGNGLIYDYELSTHTRGVSGSLIDQISSQHLINFTGSYTTASIIRDNNTQMLNGVFGRNSVNQRTVFAVLVDSTNPTNGLCYNAAGQATTCFPSTSNSGAASAGFGTTRGHAGVYGSNINPLFATLRQAYQGGIATTPVATCGGGPCEFFVVGDGQYATYNQVKPNFYSGSLTDEWHPTSKWTINAGVKFDDFQYVGANTAGTAARTLWYNALAQDSCINTSGTTINGILPGLIADKVRASGYGGAPLGPAQLTPASPCPAGFSTFAPTNNTGTNTFPQWEPRFGATYSLDPRTVLRFSYGRYVQGGNSAFEQYNGLQQVFPYTMYYTFGFQQYGFTRPLHAVRPEASTDYDLSLEHQFPGDLSMKLTPFYRTTQNQINDFFLNQATSFVSGLNVGTETARGLELEIDKGNFAAPGFSGRLTFTWTNAYMDFFQLSNGTNALTPINATIGAYNAYTSACGPGGSAVGKSQFGQPLCASTSTGVAAAPCYNPATGAADNPCLAGDVANPYWNAPALPLMDPKGHYPLYTFFPAAVAVENEALAPNYLASLVLNYRKGPWAVTPVLQMFAGQRYGAPLTTIGVAPETCGTLAGTVAGDPRYPYGAPGGSPFDATSCGSTLTAIPNRYTKAFDRIGAFAAPTNLLLHLQASYDLSKNVTLVMNAANIVNTCVGGTKVPWSVAGVCGYGNVAGAATGDVGNTYNPGQAVQTQLNTPYFPVFPTLPFSIYFNAKIKI